VQAPVNNATIEILGEMKAGYNEILTPDAIDFVAKLHRAFDERRQTLLARRIQLQEKWNAGDYPDFLPDTREIRESDWTVAPIPADLVQRRVEITGPVERKMIINALNSGADVFMADLEDSNTPTWNNQIEGQLNLRDAVRGTISFINEAGKPYRLNEKVAVLFVRPRGWHLDEKYLQVDGRPVSGSLFDFGLYFFHNAKALMEKGSGPYFYLPKLESHLEARLWNDVFVMAQDELGIPQGTIRATVLIETILAAFETHEILWELRDHSAGLNCGRWDYIFSFIKKFRNRPDFVLPDRAQVTMRSPFMHAYVQQVIQTCHKRGIHAMGGMAAQIPIKNDPRANEEAMDKVRADKSREVEEGHDGTWVAHPGLVPIAMEAFAKMDGPNQLHRLREDVRVLATDLVRVPEGTITEQGVRTNISVGVQYLEAWLRGNGCVPLYNLMEDAATAEISRAQLWQWVAHHAVLADGRVMTRDLFDLLLKEEMVKLRDTLGSDRYDSGKYGLASDLFAQMTHNRRFNDFLTLIAYQHI
jgi:malate synthase